MTIALDSSFIVSTSDITTGYRCEYRQLLKRSGVYLAANPDDQNNIAGTLIHAGLGVAFSTSSPEIGPIWDAIARENDAKRHGVSLETLESYSRVAARAARAFPVSEWRPVILITTGGYEVSLVEQRLYVPLDDPAEGIAASVEEYLSIWGPRPAFSFQPDAVLERRDDPDALPWGIDHKTKDSIHRPGPVDELTLQAHAYWYVLERHIGPLVGFAHYQILRDEPKRPKLNKDGSVSRAACLTDEETLIDTIRSSTVNPDPDHEDYAGMRYIARNRVWQSPFPLPDLEGVREQAMVHIRTGFKRGVHLGSEVPTGRGVACRGCEFALWCGERFEGRDPRSLLGQSYRTRGKDYLGRVVPTDSEVRSPEPLDPSLDTCHKGQSR